MNEFSKSISTFSAPLPEAPPCINCKYWKPEKLMLPASGCVGVQFSGSRLCWSEEQYSDFSCFTEKDAAQ